MPARPKTLDQLPLFASEEEISAAVLGPGKIVEWRAIVPLLEGRGFPGIDGLHGGRYAPAIKAFYDRQYCVGVDGPPAREPHRRANLGAAHGQRRPTTRP